MYLLWNYKSLQIECTLFSTLYCIYVVSRHTRRCLYWWEFSSVLVNYYIVNIYHNILTKVQSYRNRDLLHNPIALFSGAMNI